MHRPPPSSNADPSPAVAARLRAAALLAAALVAGANLWVGARLPELLQETDVRFGDEIARRVAAFPRRAEVKVVVLGNSQPLAGLRPPDLAPALGLAPHEVFSLAAPSASTLEAAILLERHRASFPGLRAVILGVNEYLFTGQAETTARYLTRHAFADRWRLARRARDLDGRLALTAVRLVPLMDAKTPLVAAVKADPALAARRMVGPAPAPPTSEVGRWRAHPWPWGMPPPWEALSPAARAAFLEPRWAAIAVNVRAASFLPPDAGALVAAGLLDLEELIAYAGREGLALGLVELPYVARLRGALARLTDGRDRAYREARDGFVRRAGLRLIPPPPGLVAADFYDPDHLAPAGSRKMSAWTAARLREGPVGAALAR